MAELWKITLPSGNTYELKDKYARDLIAQLLNFNHYLGVTTTALVEDDTTNPITISGESVTATAGDVVTLSSDNSEMIYNSLGKWQKFGTLSGLGLLAYKDSASGTYTPAGTVSQPSFSNGSCTPSGSVSNIELNTKTVKQFKTAGSMPTYTVSNETLTISAGEVPTGEDVIVGDGTVKTQPSFTGTASSVTGTVSQPSFTGTEATITVS